jgi:phosphopantothenoylcysteine decarboxylase/phosphopantothenate--cysteine ligase
MKLLVTSGATREPIDEVRFLSNVSTGATGAALAEAFAARGHAVTLLAGQSAVRPTTAPEIEVETFSSAQDLLARLTRHLGAGDVEAVLMAAAVSDYRPETNATGKISSELETLTVRFVRNPKLLPRLKLLSPRPFAVIGFKLTVGADATARRAAVAAQLASGGVDAVVQNDLAEIHAAPRDAHPFNFYAGVAALDAPRALAGVPALAVEIEHFLCARTPGA